MTLFGITGYVCFVCNHVRSATNNYNYIADAAGENKIGVSFLKASLANYYPFSTKAV